MRLETMQEWTERVLEGVRILFQMGQNRAFHMSYIGGGGEMLLKVLYRGMIAGGVVLAVLLLRMMLCRAPKIYSYLLWGLVLYWLPRPFTFVSPLSFMGAFSKTDGALAHAKPYCQGNCAGGSCRGGQQAAGRQRGSDRFFQDGRREREGENDTALRGGRDLDCTGCEVKMCGACETIYRETVRGSSRLEAPSYILLCVNQ